MDENNRDNSPGLTQPQHLEKSSHRKADVTIDSVFPKIETKLPIKQIEDLAYIVSYHEQHDAMQHTLTMGRAGFYPISFEVEGRRFNCILVKGTGSPSQYIDHQDNTAFDVHKRDNKKMFLPVGLDKQDVTGLCTREDQVLDAEKSLQLHKLGIKVRLPLQGFYLNQIETEHGIEQVKDLVERGLLDSLETPYMSYWAMETPYRVDDLCRVVSRAKNEEEIRNFLIDAARYTALSNDARILDFNQKFNKLVKNNATTAGLLELWTDLILNQVEESFNKLKTNRILHHNLHGQNVSLHGEICDNSEISTEQQVTEQVFQTYHRREANNFFDTFSKIWVHFGEQNQIDEGLLQRFNQRIDKILEGKFEPEQKVPG